MGYAVPSTHAVVGYVMEEIIWSTTIVEGQCRESNHLNNQPRTRAWYAEHAPEQWITGLRMGSSTQYSREPARRFNAEIEHAGI